MLKDGDAAGRPRDVDATMSCGRCDLESGSVHQCDRQVHDRGLPALFIVVKGVNQLRRTEEAKPATPPAPSREEVLLGEIRDLLKK